VKQEAAGAVDDADVPVSHTPAALLLLADGRFPAGAYAHSGGLEPAMAAGQVRDLDAVRAFLSGRLETVGAVAATFAAACCAAASAEDRAWLAALDAGLDARMPAPAARATSRQLGRQLVRAVERVRPDQQVRLLGSEPHQPLAFGLAGGVFGLSVRDVAVAVLHDTAAGVVAAAVRLGSFDPLAAHAVLAGFAPRIDQLADAAAARHRAEVAQLPAYAAPLLDLYAEQHAHRRTRLFAS
jgi:urease accessory protein